MQINLRYKSTRMIQAFQRGQLDEADRLALDILALDIRSSEALLVRGAIAGLEGRYADAEQLLRAALKYEKNNPSIFFNLAKALSEQKKERDALKWHRKALDLDPLNDVAWLNYGKSLYNLGEIDSAIKVYDRALAANGDLAEAHTNKGICLCEKRRFEESIAAHDRAIKLNPRLAEAWNNRGNTFGQFKYSSEALESFDQAISLRPNYSEVWLNKGIVLNELKRYEEALMHYERAIQLNPNLEFIFGDLIHIRMKLCCWTGLDLKILELKEGIIRNQKISSPFPILSLLDSQRLQSAAAKIYAETEFSRIGAYPSAFKKQKSEKIRIGYFSSDFGDHPVSYLIAELIEFHDRAKFEIYAFSFSADTADPMRGRLERAFDKFFDIQKLNEFEAVRLSRELEVDIAIDLGGYTMNSRPKIFCLRAAPIQISYLGYPGTSGNKNIDYFIGDPITITDQNREHFTEKIIQLPNSFLVNPSKRPIAQEEPSRLECGLPENGFVFCCFNSLWKLTPEVFKSWVRILQSIDDSILWLQTSGETQQKNLVQAFESESISKTRIIFANRVPSLSDHLCRYRKASVFLDTFPYGAHTTASDALWAGLPVLTRAGESFASRVAASLLYSVGLPELITNTAREYESAAIELANNPQMVSKMKAKLVENRSTCPLFNAAVVTRQIEAGYQAAYNRYHANLEPDHIYVGSR